MSTRTQHTPSPWIVKDQGGPSVIIEASADSACNINPSGGYQVAEVFNAGPECGQEDCRFEAYANAHLMAASPVMLVALEECITESGTMAERSHAYAMRRLNAITALAYAAIAQAQGGYRLRKVRT